MESYCTIDYLEIAKLKQLEAHLGRLSKIEKRIWNPMTSSKIDLESPESFIVMRKFYQRSLKLEAEYLERYRHPVFSLFNHQCAVCNSKQLLDNDHFFISKSQGGTFCLIHTSGKLVNNLMPLCRKCNRGKKDRPFREFCGDQIADKIIKLNLVISETINNDTYIHQKLGRNVR